MLSNWLLSLDSCMASFSPEGNQSSSAKKVVCHAQRCFRKLIESTNSGQQVWQLKNTDHSSIFKSVWGTFHDVSFSCCKCLLLQFVSSRSPKGYVWWVSFILLIFDSSSKQATVWLKNGWKFKVPNSFWAGQPSEASLRLFIQVADNFLILLLRNRERFV